MISDKKCDYPGKCLRWHLRLSCCCFFHSNLEQNQKSYGLLYYSSLMLKQLSTFRVLLEPYQQSATLAQNEDIFKSPPPHLQISRVFCLLLGPPGFNCWFSLAPVFQWCCSTPGISGCRLQYVSVESSSMLHHSIYL